MLPSLQNIGLALLVALVWKHNNNTLLLNVKYYSSVIWMNKENSHIEFTVGDVCKPVAFVLCLALFSLLQSWNMEIDLDLNDQK